MSSFKKERIDLTAPAPNSTLCSASPAPRFQSTPCPPAQASPSCTATRPTRRSTLSSKAKAGPIWTAGNIRWRRATACASILPAGAALRPRPKAPSPSCASRRRPAPSGASPGATARLKTAPSPPGSSSLPAGTGNWPAFLNTRQARLRMAHSGAAGRNARSRRAHGALGGKTARGQKKSAPRGARLGIFALVGRAPGNLCYRCFLSDLTGLAALPPPGLEASLHAGGRACQRQRQGQAAKALPAAPEPAGGRAPLARRGWLCVARSRGRRRQSCGGQIPSSMP